jgi:hypothetical protein
MKEKVVQFFDAEKQQHTISREKWEGHFEVLGKGRQTWRKYKKEDIRLCSTVKKFHSLNDLNEQFVKWVCPYATNQEIECEFAKGLNDDPTTAVAKFFAEANTLVPSFCKEHNIRPSGIPGEICVWKMITEYTPIICNDKKPTPPANALALEDRPSMFGNGEPDKPASKGKVFKRYFLSHRVIAKDKRINLKTGDTYLHYVQKMDLN